MIQYGIANTMTVTNNMFLEKHLYIGNNTIDTDIKVSNLATQYKTINHGLVDSKKFIPLDNGLYHTTVSDLTVGDIIEIAKYFDLVALLDQPKNEWSHSKLLFTSYNLMRELEKAGHKIKFKDNKNIVSFSNFEQLLKTNKSFCIYPWINVVLEDNKNTKICARSSYDMSEIDNIKNWQHNPRRLEIKNKMLAGEKLTEICKTCYNYENVGAESYRQFETKEWVNHLDIETLDDLKKIKEPYYYEIRLSNKCNVMCRGCQPRYSHLIDKESKKFNISPLFPQKPISYGTLDVIQINSLTNKHRVYLTGGEPSIMTDVYRFMQQCIDKGKTDFNLTMSTNGEKFSSKFLRLSEKFSNMNFSFSLDGFGRVNDYWRWGTHWENIITNMKTCENMGHSININCVPGIYNVTNLHLLYEFLDNEFPDTSVYIQYSYTPIQSAFNHPDHDMVISSMEKCKKTKVYQSNGKTNKTGIDALYDHYIKKPQTNIQHLKEFFEYNDKLDHARNSKLGDYIPELEACRKYIY